jgi:hypothetical protein
LSVGSPHPLRPRAGRLGARTAEQELSEVGGGRDPVMVRAKSAVPHLGQSHIHRREPHRSVLGTMGTVKKHHVSGVSHVHPLRSVARTQLSTPRTEPIRAFQQKRCSAS